MADLGDLLGELVKNRIKLEEIDAASKKKLDECEERLKQELDEHNATSEEKFAQLKEMGISQHRKDIKDAVAELESKTAKLEEIRKQIDENRKLTFIKDRILDERKAEERCKSENKHLLVSY